MVEAKRSGRQQKPNMRMSGLPWRNQFFYLPENPRIIDLQDSSSKNLHLLERNVDLFSTYMTYKDLLRLCNQIHHLFISETSISTCLKPHGPRIITYYNLLINVRRHELVFFHRHTYWGTYLYWISWKKEQVIPPNKHWHLQISVVFGIVSHQKQN